MDAKTIKNAREKRGHTFTEAAAEIGVSAKSWANWEKGTSYPRSPVIKKALLHYVAEAMA